MATSSVGTRLGTVVGETNDGNDLIIGTTDDSRIEDWDVDSNEDGTTTTAHIREELARHLPTEWKITTFDPWGPNRTNHGGGIHYQVHLTHQSGAEIQIRPDTTWPDDKTKTVYNSHKITVVGVDGSREKIVSAKAMVRAEHPAAIFKPVVKIVSNHQPQRTLGDF